MDEYRLYFVDERGAPLGAFAFTSADDQFATEAARQFGGEGGAELWCGPRKVKSWRAKPAASPTRSTRTTEDPAAAW